MAMVRCPEHGRIYDDAVDRGCPACMSVSPADRRAKAREKPEEKPSRLPLYVLAGIVIVGGGGYLGWDWYRQKQAEEAAAAERRRLDIISAPAVDTTRFARADDLTPIRRARALRTALLNLLGNNRSTLLGFAAGPVDTSVTERAERQRALAYHRFWTRWHAAIESATRDGADFRYEQGVQYSLQMQQATNHLRAALAVMRDMVRENEVKPRAERQADLTAARGYLSSAGTVLTTLPR